MTSLFTPVPYYWKSTFQKKNLAGYSSLVNSQTMLIETHITISKQTDPIMRGNKYSSGRSNESATIRLTFLIEQPVWMLSLEDF